MSHSKEAKNAPQEPKKTLIIAAGGTGGHFFPAEATAYYLEKMGYHLVLMTDNRNHHKEKGIFSHYPHYILPGSGIAGKGILQKIKGMFSLLWGSLKARRLIKKIKPVAIIGFGGYPSIPPLFGARLIARKKRPFLILHEGNAILGKANAFIAPHAQIIATSYEHVEKIPPHIATKYVGMPVRHHIEALSNAEYPPLEIKENSNQEISLLIWGGSLGASIFGEIIPPALANLPISLRRRLHVTQQIQQKDMVRIHSTYAEAGIKATLATFIHNVPEHLKRAHLIIGRSGGSSIAELTLSGRPSLLVPLPIAASDEQGWNAKRLEEKGAAWMIRQENFTSEMLTQKLIEVFTTAHLLENAAKASKSMQQLNAAQSFASLIAETISSPQEEGLKKR